MKEMNGVPDSMYSHVCACICSHPTHIPKLYMKSWPKKCHVFIYHVFEEQEIILLSNAVCKTH